MSINPQPYKDGYISIVRNVFLTSSVSIALIISSDNFVKYKKLLYLLSAIIIIYSIIYGIIAGIDSYEYINIMRKDKNLPELYRVVLKNWEKWVKITSVYIGILSILFIVIFLRKVY